MAKRISALILLLSFLSLMLLTGCEKLPTTSSEFLQTPSATVRFNYEQASYQYTMPLDSSVIYMAGDSMVLVLEFDTAIAQDSYDQYIKTLENESLTVTPAFDNSYKSFELNFSSIAPDDRISFTLSSHIENQNGIRLKENIVVDFLVAEPIRAAYTILGESYDIYYPTGNISSDYGAEDKLANSELKLKIDFSKEVNTADVEEIIKRELFSSEDRYFFDWQSPKSLIINTEKLTDKFYGLQLFSYRTPIINGLYFDADDGNILYSYSFEQESLKEEKAFKDYRYLLNKNPFIEDYLLMVDTTDNYIYHLKEDSIINSKDEELPAYWAMKPWFQEVLWLDKDTILWIENDIVYTYNFKAKVRKTLFSIEKRPEEGYIFEYTLSPDKKKLAIAFGTFDDNPEKLMALVSVYSLDGKRIYGDMLIKDIRHHWLAGYIFQLNLSWFSNSELIHEVSTGQGLTGVALTNILNGTTKILLEDGIAPLTSANSGIFIAKQGEEYIINSSEKSVRLPADGISDIIVRDRETILIAREINGITALISYNITTEKESTLGEISGIRLRFLGNSPDMDKIYMITNQMPLMPIT